MEQRDIVLVLFPFSDLKSEKVRPTIIVSNNDYNRKFEDIVVVPLTSNLALRDYTIKLTNQDLEEGDILRESNIKVDRIFSINKKAVYKIIGKINKQKFRPIKEMVYKLID